MEDNFFKPNEEFDYIRIVHTNRLWQENESNWCDIAVYDKSGRKLADGRDVLTFSGGKFYMECLKNVDGFICYGATFKFPDRTYHNCLEITVINR